MQLLKLFLPCTKEEKIIEKVSFNNTVILYYLYKQSIYKHFWKAIDYIPICFSKIIHSISCFVFLVVCDTLILFKKNKTIAEIISKKFILNRNW